MADCKACTGGGCGSCGGCGNELVLCPGEAEVLQLLGQYAFLPVARKADDMTPVFREAQAYTPEEYSLFIQLLEKKQLLYLDYTPLPGADMSAYAGYPVHGSMGLTKRGQEILAQLELQGASE